MKKITLLLIGIGLAFTGFAQTPLYTYDFESGPGGWVIDNTISGSWALGTPAAPIINSAASGTNAFATNLLADYNPNENSTVTSPSINISAATGKEVVTLNVWWNSENSWDGANLFASYDGGTTWAIVGADGDPNNWYNDNTINGAPQGSQEGWTGRNSSSNGSGGWVLAEHALDSAMLVNNTALMLRVGFGSDGSITDDGFAFDDVTVGEPLINDAGIASIDLINPVVAGVQAIDVTISNFGVADLTSANIEWSIDGVLQPSFAWTGNILPNGTLGVTIGAANIPAGVTEICAWTTLPNGIVDLDNSNDTVCSNICTALAGGTYTLGGVGADFATFPELGSILSSCGIAGNVVVNVAPGTYTGRLILDHVVGTSSTSTITVNGGDASLVTLVNTTFSNIYIDGTDWTTIKNITLENLGTTDVYGVQLRDQATNNTIDSCIINMNTTATFMNDVVGVNTSNLETSDNSEGQNAYFTTVSNNQINGGELGIRFEGANANRNVGNIIINNTIDLCEDYGIYVDDQDSIQIIGNTVTNLRNTAADGIFCTDIMMFDVSYNNVNAPDWGMYIFDGNFDAIPTSRGKIINNMVSSASDYGMEFDDINETDIFHNTVSSASTFAGAFSMNDFVDVDIRNNIFYSEGDYALESEDDIATGGNTIDYNSYYSNGPNLIEDLNALYVDLASWQAAQPTVNMNSIEVVPGFVSVTDLHATSPLVNDAGDNSVGIIDDIDGDVRPMGLSVDMGADEFTPIPIDAGLIGFPNLVSVLPGMQPIEVAVQNFGALNLTTATIEWTVDGVPQTASAWAGNLAPYDVDTHIVGSLNIPVGTTTIRAWMTLPNGVVDPVNSNDTTEITFCTGLAGTYTLGGVGADFVDFADLSNQLNTCGVGGSVIVNVAPGTYTGRLILDHVVGTSSTSTITVNGGDASLVTLSNATFSNVYINGTDWTTIKNMTLENLATNDAYGVQLRDQATSNTIDSCIINMNTTATFMNDVVGVNTSDTETLDASEGQNAYFTTVSNNQINGGELGIRFEGQAANRNIGNRFVNNTIDLCEDYGIFVDDQDSIQIIGNTITNLRNAFADGINCTDIMMFDISYNNVVNAPDWGMAIMDGNFDAVPTSRGKIINNMVSSVSDYGMEFDDMEETDIFHNTVANASTFAGAFNMNDFTNVDIRNNIFYSEGDFAFESEDNITTNGNTVDFNSYYSNGPNLIEDLNTVYADLAAWQVGQPTANLGSIEIDPLFVSTTDLHITSPFVNDLGDITLVSIVSDDIDGDVRPAPLSFFPDMGADEFTPTQNDAGITSIDSLINPITIGLQDVYVTIENFGALNLTAANIEWSVDGVVQTTSPWVGNLSPITADGSLIGSYNFVAGITEVCAWTTLPNGMLDEDSGNDTTCMIFCTPLSGTYTLGGAGADFATFTELGDILSSCGVGADVVVNVTPGTYTDRLILDHVPGASIASTITINGGNASLVTLSNTTFSNVYLNGTDWTTVKNMTLENLGTTDAYGVQLRDSAMNNTIDSCIINMDVASNGADIVGVSASNSETSSFTEGQNAYFTTVSNNQINGGETGIRFEGQAANRNVGNRFVNNTIDLCEDFGIFVDDQDSIQIIGNTITNLRNAFADGINCTDIMMFDISYNNLVAIPDFGLNISDGNFDAVPTSRGTIINNMIGSATDYAIYLDDIEETDVFHNTAGNLSTISGAIRLNDMADVDIRNNIFYSEGDYALESDDDIVTGGNTIDYNSYYSNGPNLIEDLNAVYVDLAAWQAAQPTANLASVEIDPVFVSPTDLHVLSPFVNDLGDVTVGIVDDIDGDARPAGIFVDMGADEFTPSLNNAAFEAFVDLDLCGDVMSEVRVAIRNMGANTLTAMNINVEVTGDAVASLSFAYTGSLGFGDRDTVTVGTFDSYTGLNYNLDGYVDLVGEEDTSDDSLSISIDVTPFEPTGLGGFACVGVDSAVISALSLQGTAYFWYDSLVGGNQVGSGDDFLVPSIIAQDTYYVEYANNSDSLETTFAAGSGCGGGNMFDITAINSVNINAISVHSNEPIGTLVPVTIHYIMNGTYVGNETNSAAWTTVPGGPFNAISAGAGNPSKVEFLGTPIVIPAGATYAMYVEYDAEYTVGANTYANADIIITTGAGLCNSFLTVNTPRTFNGIVHYGSTACSAIRTPVTVDITASAVASFTSSVMTSGTVNFDATATTNADSVLWNFDDGNTSTSLTPTNTYATNGNYNVCLYAYSDCGIDTLCQSTSTSVGVEELNSLATANVFPNPSNGQFVLDLTNYSKDDLNVVVLNQLGKVIYSKSYSNNDQGRQHTIDLSAYANGVYFLKLSSNEDVTTKKIIIQK